MKHFKQKLKRFSLTNLKATLLISSLFGATIVNAQTETDTLAQPKFWDPCTWRTWDIWADGVNGTTCVYAGDVSKLTFDTPTLSGDAHLTIKEGKYLGVMKLGENNKDFYGVTYPSGLPSGIDFNSREVGAFTGNAEVWWNPNIISPSSTVIEYHFWTGNFGKPCEHYRGVTAYVYPKAFKNIQSSNFSITTNYNNSTAKCDWQTFGFNLTSTVYKGNYESIYIDWSMPSGWSLAPGETNGGWGKTNFYATPNSKTKGYVPNGLITATLKNYCGQQIGKIEYYITGTQPILVSNMPADINMCGGSGGTTTINPQILGGKAPYTYTWDGVWPICATCSTQTIKEKDLYSNESKINFTVTDANGCNKTQSSLIHKKGSSTWQASLPYTGTNTTPNNVSSEIEVDSKGNPIFIDGNKIQTYRWNSAASKWELKELKGSTTQPSDFFAENDIAIDNLDVIYLIKIGGKQVNKIPDLFASQQTVSKAYGLPATDPSTIKKIYYANQRLFFINSLGQVGYFTGVNTVKYLGVTLASVNGSICLDSYGFYYVSSTSNSFSYYNMQYATKTATAIQANPLSYIQGDNFGRVFFVNSSDEISFVTGNTNAQYPAFTPTVTYGTWNEAGPYFSVNPASGVVYSVGVGGLLKQVYLEAETGYWKSLDFMATVSYDLSALSPQYVKFRYPNVFFKDSDNKLKMAYFYVTDCTPAVIRKAENTNNLEAGLNIDTTFNQNELQVSLYPNPNNGVFNISISSIDADANVEILNTFGENVATLPLQIGNNTIDLQHLPKGLFIAQIVVGQKITTQKVIIK